MKSDSAYKCSLLKDTKIADKECSFNLWAKKKKLKNQMSLEYHLNLIFIWYIGDIQSDSRLGTLKRNTKI